MAAPSCVKSRVSDGLVSSCISFRSSSLIPRCFPPPPYPPRLPPGHPPPERPPPPRRPPPESSPSLFFGCVLSSLFNFHDPLKFLVLGTSAAGALALLAVFVGEVVPGAGDVVCVIGPAGACAYTGTPAAQSPPITKTQIPVLNGRMVVLPVHSSRDSRRKFPPDLPGDCFGLAQPMTKVGRTRKQRQCAKLAESLRSLSIPMLARSNDRHERHSRLPRRQRVINVIAKIQRRRRIAFPQNLVEPLGVRLNVLHVAHRNNHPKFLRRRPLCKRIRELLSRTPCKQIQLIPLRPPLNLRR